MCPVCLATAALIAGNVASGGGLAAIAITKLGVKNALNIKPSQVPSKVNSHE
jgi:hypothetical protein